MSLLLSRTGSGRPSEAAQVVDLDVTPVMNMFIILIPFLVSMAVFTHLASHALTLPGDEGAGQAQIEADLPVTIVLALDEIVVLKGDLVLGRLASPAVASGLPELGDLLGRLRTNRPEIERLVLAVDDAVTCAQVVGCLDICHGAGYDDVGLADAAGHDSLDDGSSVGSHSASEVSP